MRIWVDLANSPHVGLFAPIVARLEAAGDTVILSARDHAQTLELARRQWPQIVCIGGPSPAGVVRKSVTIAGRAAALARFAEKARPDVALSHGSYAQIVAARALGLPTVTMMDYEFQPANHLSFRLADRVVVPAAFDPDALQRLGAANRSLRYPGYKEEVYLAGLVPDLGIIPALGLDPADVIVVLRPPPNGALYHRVDNPRFEAVARAVAATAGVRIVLLARGADRTYWSRELPTAVIPAVAVDGPALLAAVDLTIGAGDTMNRESALLGTPTYTVFGGRLAGVDAALVDEGRLHDLRDPDAAPLLVKKQAMRGPAVAPERREQILRVLDRALEEATRVPARRRRLRATPHRA